MRSHILVLSALLAAIVGLTLREHGRSATAGAMPQDLEDLYGLFQDEIRAEPSDNFSGNVYAGMGNRLQLDGKAYNYLFQALNACERLRATLKAPEFGGRQESIRRQTETARRLFDAVLENLAWPRYRIDLLTDHAEIEGPPRVTVFESIPQSVLLTVKNTTGVTQSVRVEAAGLITPQRIDVAPDAVRYASGILKQDRVGESTVKLSAAYRDSPVHRTIAVEAAPTGILELSLVNERGSASAARVRVTDKDGRYLPPENHTYGLILKMFGPEHDQIARRWFYNDGVFRVRAPAGPINVSVRKGLEYRSLDLKFDVAAGRTTKETVKLTRWADMPKRGWYAADVHLHYFDPPSVRFEMEAEDVVVADVLVMNHYGAITARKYFTGAPDPISDANHLIYYNEEFRHNQLGHLGLLNLKSLVEPISIGGLGSSQPQFFRGAHFDLSDEHGKRRADAASPDRLLIEAMRETHRQGGLVNLAHLRDELEFALDAALGQLDTVDILTDTKIDEALTFWYHMLNCGLRLPATAGTDRAEPHIPIGHQRTYARLSFPFSNDDWVEAIRKGASFVTNGPMIQLTAEKLGPGEELVLSRPGKIRIVAHAESQLPIQKLEIVQNGEVVRSANADPCGCRAETAFDLMIQGPAWIAARVMGAKHPEIMYYPHPEWSHPVVAHTSPIYVKYGHSRLAVPASARYLLGRMHKLEAWARDEAYFANAAARDEALLTIAKGSQFYRSIAEK